MRLSRPDCRHQRLDADDVDDPRQIVGQHTQGHFGSDILEPLHQEVSCTHPHLDGPERVLDRLSALAHGLRVLIEPPLYRFQNLLVLPPGDHPVCALSAACLHRAGLAPLRRISPEVETIALPLV